MNCASVLETLLDADLSEMRGEGSSALANHLRLCDQCRRVAGQLLVDTQLLAKAIQAPVAPRRVAHRTRYATLAPVGLVAVLLVVAVFRAPREGQVPTIATDAPLVSSAPESRSAEPPIANQAPIVRAAPPTRVWVPASRAFPQPMPLVPVRMAESVPSRPISVSAPTVSVDPPAGTRAAVLHTSNPKLVVVWLY